MKKKETVKAKKIENTEIIDEKKLNRIDEEIKKNKNKKKNKQKNKEKKKYVIINMLALFFAAIYILVIISATKQIPENEFISDLVNFSYFFLILAVVIFEIAYKKDNFKIGLFGIESAVLAGITLFILDMTNKQNDNFFKYCTCIIAAICIYYIIKIIVILAKKQKK